MCAAAVDETLRPLPGVADVKIDFDNKLAYLAVDADKFDAKDALKRLGDKGYESTKAN